MNEKPTSYETLREAFNERFGTMSPVADSVEIHHSPSGRYALETSEWSNGDGRWNYSRGVVSEIGSTGLVADVRRNYSHFWHAWVSQGSREYLVCGEDYQGYSVIDLARGVIATHFPPEGFDGRGFCWTAAHPSPDGLLLAVEGCYWACPYELVIVDFRDPLELPLRKIARFDELDAVTGWNGNDEFRLAVYEGEDSRPVTWSRHAGLK